MTSHHSTQSWDPLDISVFFSNVSSSSVLASCPLGNVGYRRRITLFWFAATSVKHGLFCLKLATRPVQTQAKKGELWNFKIKQLQCFVFVLDLCAESPKTRPCVRCGQWGSRSLGVWQCWPVRMWTDVEHRNTARTVSLWLSCVCDSRMPSSRLKLKSE